MMYMLNKIRKSTLKNCIACKRKYLNKFTCSLLGQSC